MGKSERISAGKLKISRTERQRRPAKGLKNEEERDRTRGENQGKTGKYTRMTLEVRRKGGIE